MMMIFMIKMRMKKTKKIITILMLISMISSFLSPLCVNALTSGDVYNYITNTKTTYNNLKTKKATVVNLHRLQKDQAKRVVDFLSGVIYAIEGDIQRIGPKIFLCTPRNISVAGTIDLDEDEQED